MSQTSGVLYSERTPISFVTSVAASTTATLPYKIIDPSIIQDITINFALNQQRTLQVYIYTGPFGTSQDDPLFNTPVGYNFPYVVGDNNQLRFNSLGTFIEAGQFLTVVAINTDGVTAHTLDVQIVISRI
jgi:hypothetical protein